MHKLFLLCLLLIAVPVSADVTLSWGTSEGATGYVLWYGTEAPPAGTIHPDGWEFPYKRVVEGDTREATLKGLPPGTWYFGATAYNEVGQSAYSNIVNTTVASYPPPVSQPHKVIDIPLPPNGVVQINVSVGK